MPPLVPYISKTRNNLYRQPYTPELVYREGLCLSPKLSKYTEIYWPVNYLLDSGAFQDRTNRVSFSHALQRQLDLEEKIGWKCEKIVAYDRVGDLKTTICANHFLNTHRDDLSPRQLVFVIQGETIWDRIACYQDILTYITPRDCLGIGGIATSAKNKKVFADLIGFLDKIQPISGDIHYVHLFGVGHIQTLRDIRQHISPHICLSFDTSSIEMASLKGRVLDVTTGKWIKEYSAEDRGTLYDPAPLAHKNLNTYINFIRRELS